MHVIKIAGKSINLFLPVSVFLVVGGAVVVFSSLLVVGVSPTTDDDVAGTLSEGVGLISCDEVLAVAVVFSRLFVAVARIVTVVLTLKEAVVFKVVFCEDTEDDANP